MASAKEKQGLMLAGCGGLLVFLSFVGTGLLIAAPVLSDGGISTEESLPGFAGNCCCLVSSLAATIGGLVIYKKAKDNASNDAASANT